MVKKHSCCRCGLKAVWYYVPWSREKVEHESYYCDDHVSRGCSCNMIQLDPDPNDPGAYEQHTDEQGRLLPCCEYDWDGEGFDKPEDFAAKYDSIAAEYDED